MSHYDMANRLERRNLYIGIPVVVISALVGASSLASVLAELVPVWAKVVVGLSSVTAGVLAALQTFFKFSERAERHRTFGAKYGSIRRELEALHASGRAEEEPNFIGVLRERLDRLAEEAPAVPADVFARVAAYRS